MQAFKQFQVFPYSTANAQFLEKEDPLIRPHSQGLDWKTKDSLGRDPKINTTPVQIAPFTSAQSWDIVHISGAILS